ncbi:MAG: transcription antitermination factor NusB [Planctomycetota bacterium]|nr:MAG: transcription antitermination factor NusB [Planctomycetota bacterium]
MRTRSKSREYALQFLYQMEIRKEEHSVETFRVFIENADGKEEAETFTEDLIKGVSEHLSELDEIISDCLMNWDMKRISLVDKIILRIATYELIYNIETPSKVAVNEAIELGKKFGSKETGSFINGVLDKILKTKISL